MPVRKFDIAKLPSYERIDVTPEIIEQAIARGRRERSEYMMNALLRAATAVRRLFDRAPRPTGVYRLSGGAGS